jgi:hypothetical protein
VSALTEVWVTCSNRNIAKNLADALNKWQEPKNHTGNFIALTPSLESDNDIYMASEVCTVVGEVNHLDRDEMMEIIKSFFAEPGLRGFAIYYHSVVVVTDSEYDDRPSSFRLSEDGKWM